MNRITEPLNKTQNSIRLVIKPNWPPEQQKPSNQNPPVPVVRRPPLTFFDQNSKIESSFSSQSSTSNSTNPISSGSRMDVSPSFYMTDRNSWSSSEQQTPRLPPKPQPLSLPIKPGQNHSEATPTST